MLQMLRICQLLKFISSSDFTNTDTIMHDFEVVNLKKKHFNIFKMFCFKWVHLIIKVLPAKHHVRLECLLYWTYNSLALLCSTVWVILGPFFMVADNLHDSSFCAARTGKPIPWESFDRTYTEVKVQILHKQIPQWEPMRDRVVFAIFNPFSISMLYFGKTVFCYSQTNDFLLN